MSAGHQRRTAIQRMAQQTCEMELPTTVRLPQRRRFPIEHANIAEHELTVERPVRVGRHLRYQFRERVEPRNWA